MPAQKNRPSTSLAMSGTKRAVGRAGSTATANSAAARQRAACMPSEMGCSMGLPG